MWFEQFVRRESGCVSYMIGSTKTGECAVVDALWDVTPYLEMAKRMNAKIRYIIDTHTHADHVSGARRLAYKSKGELIMPQLAELSYPARRVHDGDRLRMGDVLLEMMHTPGHRPEMISILVTDLTRSYRPWCILTGDFVLVGDLGRPDLAQDGDKGARMIFSDALPRLQSLDDFVELYPGHVAGSTCGRVTSGKAVSTVGFERRFNWLFQIRDCTTFVAEMNAGQPARPANAANIVAINQGKQPLAMERPDVPTLSVESLKAHIEAGYLVVDLRSPASFANGHLPGAYNVPLESEQFEQWIGWVTPADAPLILMMEAPSDVERALQKLAFLGLDGRVAGCVSSDIMSAPGIGLMPRRLANLSPQQLYERLRNNGKDNRHLLLHILDVRTCSEWQNGHISGAKQWSLQQLGEQIGALPLSCDDHIAVICTSGARSSIASSMLLHHGYRNVFTVAGGMNAWQGAGLPVVECCDDDMGLSWRECNDPYGSRPSGGEKLAAMPAPVLAQAEDCQDFNLPYWMEMGAMVCVN